MNIGDLFFTFRGESQQLIADAQKAGVQAGSKFGMSFGDRLKSQMSAKNIGTAIGAAVGTVGIGLLKIADDYDNAMDTIRVGTGATGDALKGLESDFKAVAGRVPDDLSTISTVIADLNTRTGQTGEGLQSLAEKLLDLSRITGTDASSNVAAMTRLFGDWSVATEDQSEVLDKLFRASQATGIGVDELAQKMVQFGAPLRNIGYDLEDGAAMLAKWEKEGVNTTLALGGLKIALGEFAKEGVDAKEGLADLVEQILNAETAAEAMAIGVDKFGSRAGPDMVAAIKEGRFAFDDLIDVVENGTDTIDQATKDTEGFGEAWRQLKNVVATTAGPIVREFAGIASELGNLVFLLPALGGALGRGMGALWTKAGGGAAVRAAAAAAGAAAGLIYQGAAFVASKFVAAGLALWAAMSGSRVLAAATAAGAKAGVAYAGAAGAAGLVGGITKALALMGPLAIPVALAVVAVNTDTAKNQAKLEDAARVDRSNPEKDVLADLNQGLANAGVPLGIFGVHPQDRADARATGEELGREIGTGVSEGATETVAQQSKAVGVSIGEAFQKVAIEPVRRIAELVKSMIPQWRELDASIIDLAVGGLGRLKKESQSADEQWAKLIKTGDRNRQSIVKLNAEIAKWERRYQRAIKNNDSEAAAFAAAQLNRLTSERQSRQAVVDKVNAQHKALNALPKKTTTTVVANTAAAQAAVNRLQTTIRGLTSGEYVVRIGGQTYGGIGGRASGGPVQAYKPYWVGELGRRELFVPDRPGRIVPDDEVSGGNITVNAEINGLPLRADTPREVVSQLRRAARMGLVVPSPQRGFA